MLDDLERLHANSHLTAMLTHYAHLGARLSAQGVGGVEGKDAFELGRVDEVGTILPTRRGETPRANRPGECGAVDSGELCGLAQGEQHEAPPCAC